MLVLVGLARNTNNVTAYSVRQLIMTEKPSLEIKSPCISVCAMDDLTGLCQGCYRTLDEIKGWWDMPPAEQQALLAELEFREQEQVNFDD